MRILVVDDSAFMRNMLRGMFKGEPDLELVGMACDGVEAVKLAAELKPDIITLDIEMPKMSGLDALRVIMRESPTAVVVCSSLTTEASKEALEALRLGAVDYIAKASSSGVGSGQALRTDLLAKIRGLAGVGNRIRSGVVKPGFTRGLVPLDLGKKRFGLIAIGSSTGGPPVLENIITSLPSDLAVPVVIAQHMPPVFTKSMADRLDQESALAVVEAEDGTPLFPGTVCIAPGGRQLRVVRQGGGKLVAAVGDEPADAVYKPCVNVLFESCAKASLAPCLAVVCTGMGDDGADGAEIIKKARGMVLTQSEASSVVYGMPRAVDARGLSDGSGTPELLGATLAQCTASAWRQGRRAR